MKIFLLLISVAILFQSCYSYKAIDNISSQYEIGKTYKLKQGKKSEKVKIISKTDSTLVVNHKFEEKEISLQAISKAEKRKFSIVKTVLMPVVIVVILPLAMASAVQVHPGTNWF